MNSAGGKKSDSRSGGLTFLNAPTKSQRRKETGRRKGLYSENNRGTEGFWPACKKKDGYHFGIEGIKKRTDFLGETFKIDSVLNEGTEIMITIEI